MTAPLLTVEEVCALLQVAPSFVYRHAPEMGGMKVGKHLRFRPADLEEWLARNRLAESEWSPPWELAGAIPRPRGRPRKP